MTMDQNLEHISDALYGETDKGDVVNLTEALLQISASLDYIARAIYDLGKGTGSGDPRGAIEFLAVELSSAIKSIDLSRE